MIKKVKKGFTLIELVVVIAVIAILSAVAVVSYISITNRAKESNDHMVIDQINTSLLSSQILEKKATVHEIVERFDEEEGYDVRTIKPELKNARFVYSYENGKFGYWKDSKVVYPADLAKIDFTDSNDLWFFEDEAKASYTDSYSHYLKAAGAVTSITTNGGLDVGPCTTISSINLTRSSAAKKSIVVRTKGGNLTINAVNDKVKHYGDLDSLNIETVAPTSYYENGTVGYAKIANGRLVLEEVAKIEGVFLVANASGEFDGIKLAVVGNAKLPEIARADVSLESGQSKLVVEVQTLQTSEGTDANPEFVWISKSGSEVSAIVSSSDNIENYATNVVENPSSAAATSKDGAAESADPISDASVVRINAVGYDTLQDAFDSVKDNQTIILLKDAEYNYVQEFNRNIIANLDLSNHILKVTGGTDKAGVAAGGRAIRISAGSLSIKNGTIDGRSYSNGVPSAHDSMSGPWTSTRVGGCVRITSSGSANLENLKMYNNDAWGSGIMMEASQKVLNVRNCEFESIYGSSLICGAYSGGGGTTNVYSSKFNQSAFAGFNSTCLVVQYGGTLNVYDTEIGFEDDGVEAYGMDAITTFSSGGTINIYGGKYSARNAVLHPYGCEGSYYMNYAEFAQINVFGGTFEGDYELTNEHNKIVITGGTFDHDPSSYVAEGYHATNNGDGTWTVSANN